MKHPEINLMYPRKYSLAKVIQKTKTMLLVSVLSYLVSGLSSNGCKELQSVLENPFSSLENDDKLNFKLIT